MLNWGASSRATGPGVGLRSLPLRRRLLGGDHPGLSPLAFGGLAILLGAFAGLGAYALRVLIALLHNLAFLGSFSIAYDANAHTPRSPWGLAAALVPVLGAFPVVYLVRRFAPEAKGHGVPEVMDAIYYKKSEIRPIVAAIKSLTSAISIGTGGSVGREGPIVQIGAAFGSLSGKLANVSRWQRATLVAAGGGAGIAATFNTPLGGVLFAVEVLLHEVSVRTLVPLALATTTATYVGHFLFGNQPAFPVPVITATENAAVLPAYLVLGCLTAAAAVLFIRALYKTEDAFERWLPERPYTRHAIGMLAVGLIFVAMYEWRGHYFVQGVGYATIVDVLTTERGVVFLLLLFTLKLVASSLTLGSGASGGIFSPSLFMGATLGAAFGAIIARVLPANPLVFALAGMAGMVSGVTGAVLTAPVMLFEMTLDYSVVLPMALTASVSYGVRRLLLADSVYTMKLSRRGHVMPQALQANAHLVHHVSDLALASAITLTPDVAPSSLDLRDGEPERSAPDYFVVVDGGVVERVLGRAWALGHRDVFERAASVTEVPSTPHIQIAPDATIFDLLSRLQATRASIAVVVAPSPPDQAPEILGVVTKEHLAEALAEGMELFED
ncbi:MAG: chloride channel protein [Myxococcales bacterium]|nr:chloride channel protein [Myxococcales bacterium]